MTTSNEWKMVPVEPTEEMLAAVADVDSATSNLAKAIYMAMVAAAPACIVEVSDDSAVDTPLRNTGVILDEHRSDVLNALRAMREEKSASEGGSPNSDAALNLLFSAASESVRHIMGDEPSPGETVDIIAGIFRKAMDESDDD